MSQTYSPEFYRRREAQERKLAEQAVAPAIRDIHLELAQQYAAKLLEVEAQRARTVLRPAF